MSADYLNNIVGKVLYSDDPEFETHRQVWNRGADGCPHLIVVPESANDVALAVQYAGATNKAVCIRGGGHHFAGLAVQEDAVMLHMGEMKHIVVDDKRGTVRVGAGVTIGELDAATQPYGLAVPTGTSTGTGIAGLTLGGGFGHLRRQLGLTCDNLVGAQMVLANGEVIHVSQDKNAEIFWGIRGGGGNLGVVTEFEFKLHLVGPKVAVLDVFYDATEICSILSQLREMPRLAPETLSFHLLISPVPVSPKFPSSLHGKWVIRLLGMDNSRNVNAGMTVLHPLRNLASPLFENSGIREYQDLQSCLDANFPDGLYYDGTSLFLDELNADIIGTFSDLLQNPQPVSLQLWMLGGQVNRVEREATPFPERNAQWVIFINAAGTDREKLHHRTQWMRQAIDRLGRHTAQRMVYANAIGKQELMQESIGSRVYGNNLQRLQELKMRFDSCNVFRHNVNAHPRGSSK